MTDICIFGDSVSKGVAFDEARKRYIFLPNSFSHLMESENTHIINHSKFGCTIERGLPIVEKYTDDIKNSEYTLLEFGGNDADFDWIKISESPDEIHLPHTEKTTYLGIYKKIVGEIKKLGSIPVILNLPPVDAQKYFDFFSEKMKKENILKWLGGSVDYIYRWHESYNNALEKAAESLGIKCIDIRSAFLNSKNYSDLLCADGIHPNESGHKIIFNTLIREM